MARNAHELRDATGDRDRLLAELQNLHARLEQAPGDAGLLTRISDTNTAVARADERITDLEAEIGREAAHQRIRELAAAGSVESEETQLAARNTATRATAANPVRDAALRAVEGLNLDARSADRLDGIITSDSFGTESRYLTAVAAPAYRSAFFKRLQFGPEAVFRFEPNEAEAMRTVEHVTYERGLVTAGSVAVPIDLDPTIFLTSDGTANPMRELATVITTTSNTWSGVSSTGVSASFDAEASEVSDDSPTLAAPTIVPERATAFVPFSIELGEDFASLGEQMAYLFQDAKQNLEATKFTLGAGHGSNEPAGLITSASTALYVSGSTAVMSISDTYSLQAALPPRYQPGASWVSNNTTANSIYRLVGGGNVSEPPLFNGARNVLLGKPWFEISDMASPAANALALAYGNIRSAYRIVDRVGMQIEVVQHLFGASRRPTGERGLLCLWRTSGGIVNQDALRVLKLHS